MEAARSRSRAAHMVEGEKVESRTLTNLPELFDSEPFMFDFLDKKGVLS
mgnify:CR=1 FL=1